MRSTLALLAASLLLAGCITVQMPGPEGSSAESAPAPGAGDALAPAPASTTATAQPDAAASTTSGATSSGASSPAAGAAAPGSTTSAPAPSATSASAAAPADATKLSGDFVWPSSTTTDGVVLRMRPDGTFKLEGWGMLAGTVSGTYTFDGMKGRVTATDGTGTEFTRVDATTLDMEGDRFSSAIPEPAHATQPATSGSTGSASGAGGASAMPATLSGKWGVHGSGWTEYYTFTPDGRFELEEWTMPSGNLYSGGSYDTSARTLRFDDGKTKTFHLNSDGSMNIGGVRYLRAE